VMILELGGQAVTGAPRDGARVDFTTRYPESCDWPPRFYVTVRLPPSHSPSGNSVHSENTGVFAGFIMDVRWRPCTPQTGEKTECLQESATFSRPGQSDPSGDCLPVEAGRGARGSALVVTLNAAAREQTQVDDIRRELMKLVWAHVVSPVRHGCISASACQNFNLLRSQQAFLCGG
jgi:hypothetical protein